MLDNRNNSGWADMRMSNRNCDCDCNGVGQPNEGCCSESRLIGEGIEQTILPGGNGVYRALADLVCSGGCFGDERLISYDWGLSRITGNSKLQACPNKLGDNTVRVTGSGIFFLRVTVTFRCFGSNAVHTCVKSVEQTFSQGI
ncbi:hypothetical protein BIV60_20380 [Bacillus sp. MUM 116]|nr:hypothetical protein BIV60_20380 [Bacillus sp. MUM 116]